MTYGETHVSCLLFSRGKVCEVVTQNLVFTKITTILLYGCEIRGHGDCDTNPAFQKMGTNISI